MNRRFIVKFRGVRGGYPVPGKKSLQFGGNTACVEVRCGEHLIILDAGTGIIELGEELVSEHSSKGSKGNNKPIVATLFLSHTHHDHTQGFPFFRPAYLPTSTIYMFGPGTFHQELEDTLGNAMISPFFPVNLDELPSLKVIRTIEPTMIILLGRNSSEPVVNNLYRQDKPIADDAVKITSFKSYAHPGKVIIYRIEFLRKSVVYATDIEGYVGGDHKLISFAYGADLLIHDAQYEHEEYVGNENIPSHQGWGHSTPEMAVEVAKAAKVKRLVLFHHDPLHDDKMVKKMEAKSQKLFQNTISAYEGLTVEL